MSTEQQATVRARAPFRGLEPFAVEDTAYFFGRNTRSTLLPQTFSRPRSQSCTALAEWERVRCSTLVS